MLKSLKKLLYSDAGSMSPMEGLVLAVFAVAMIVAMRNVGAFSGKTTKPSSNTISVEDKWHNLAPRQPIEPFQPLHPLNK